MLARPARDPRAPALQRHQPGAELVGRRERPPYARPRRAPDEVAQPADRRRGDGLAGGVRADRRLEADLRTDGAPRVGECGQRRAGRPLTTDRPDQADGADQCTPTEHRGEEQQRLHAMASHAAQRDADEGPARSIHAPDGGIDASRNRTIRLVRGLAVRCRRSSMSVPCRSESRSTRRLGGRAQPLSSRAESAAPSGSWRARRTAWPTDAAQVLAIHAVRGDVVDPSERDQRGRVDPPRLGGVDDRRAADARAGEGDAAPAPRLDELHRAEHVLPAVAEVADPGRAVVGVFLARADRAPVVGQHEIALASEAACERIPVGLVVRKVAHVGQTHRGPAVAEQPPAQTDAVRGAEAYRTRARGAAAPRGRYWSR